jgi:uncharacterized protein YaaQ
MTEVLVGGATVFVSEVVKFEKYWYTHLLY